MTFTYLRGAAAAALISTGLLASGCMSMDSMAMDDGMGMNASAQGDVTVGGAPMYANKTIVENAVNSTDPHDPRRRRDRRRSGRYALRPRPLHSVRSDRRRFRQTACRYGRIPWSCRANRATLTKILTYHVVAGRLSAADIMGRIRAGNGRAALTTVEGGTLTASMRGSSVILTDEKGGVATVTQADVFQSNGVIHVTDTVSMPN